MSPAMAGPSCRRSPAGCAPLALTARPSGCWSRPSAGGTSCGTKVGLRQSRVAGQFPDRPARGDLAEFHEADRVGQPLDDMQAVLDNADSLAMAAQAGDP